MLFILIQLLELSGGRKSVKLDPKGVRIEVARYFWQGLKCRGLKNFIYKEDANHFALDLQTSC